MGFVKWLGLCAGWIMDGLIGGIFGFALGSVVDKIEDSERKTSPKTARNDFSMCLLVLLAAIMKADGVVKRAELDYVKDYLKKLFGQEAAQELVLKLRDILQQDFSLYNVCIQIRQNMDYASRLELLHVLYCVAASDNDLSASEISLISEIAKYMGISEADNLSLRATFYGYSYSNRNNSSSYTSIRDDLSVAYEILEIDSSATDEDVKRAYKKMAIKYHPDKVSYLGEEAQKTAEQKFKKVNEAYEKIKKARGMN